MQIALRFLVISSIGIGISHWNRKKEKTEPKNKKIEYRTPKTTL